MLLNTVKASNFVSLENFWNFPPEEHAISPKRVQQKTKKMKVVETFCFENTVVFTFGT